jgi:hypothetical protein
MPAILHKGEAVLNAREADAYRNGAGGKGGVAVNVNMSGINVGAIATPADLAAMGEEVEKRIYRGVAQAMGAQGG